MTNPWINRAAAITLLAIFYACGYAGGRDAAVQAHYDHPACHQELKP